MAFIFPEDKADFKAPNGVTYSWDGVKWRTKTYSGAEPDARLPYRLGRTRRPAQLVLVSLPLSWSMLRTTSATSNSLASTASNARAQLLASRLMVTS